MQNGGLNGSVFYYMISGLVVAITALAGFIAKQWKDSNAHLSAQLAEEKRLREETTKNFLNQLSELAKQTREAHEREMSQVLNRLERSDQISKQQTEILAALQRRRTR